MSLFSAQMLPALVLLPFIGAFMVLFWRGDDRTLRGLGLSFAGVTGVLGALMFLEFEGTGAGFQFDFSVPWFKFPASALSTTMHIGVDGLSVLLVALTTVLIPLILIAAPGHITKRVREFLFWVLLMEAGMVGSFLALDLVLFYVFWELSLIPLYFIVGIWGGENRFYATVKFVLYTLIGSLLMLVGLIRVVLEAGTTDIPHLLTADLPDSVQQFAFVCFALAFLIKVPIVPFHTWLPDAHVQAPTAGSVVLAGVTLKMGTYALMRFGLQMLPAGAVNWAPWLLAIGVIGIIYGSLLAWAQRDMKKLVAYSSVAHLGFVVVGIFALTETSLAGAVLQGVNHGLSTGALFLLVGVIYDRRHTRQMSDFGGIARTAPAFAFLLVFATLASIGLPGTNGFVGEFLILVGTFETHRVAAILAGLGVVLGAVYMLGLCRAVLFGDVTKEENRQLEPLKSREWAALAPLCVAMLWIGLYPAPMLDRIGPACARVAERVAPYLDSEQASLPATLPLENEDQG